MTESKWGDSKRKKQGKHKLPESCKIGLWNSAKSVENHQRERGERGLGTQKGLPKVKLLAKKTRS